MNIEVINEPIVRVLDLYNATKIRDKDTFAEWCIKYLPFRIKDTFMTLQDAINLLNFRFNPTGTGAIADWIEKHTDFGFKHQAQDDQKLQKALEYIKELESKNIALRSSNTQISHELAMLQALYCKKEIAFESYKKEVIAEFIRNETT